MGLMKDNPLRGPGMSLLGKMVQRTGAGQGQSCARGHLGKDVKGAYFFPLWDMEAPLA